MDTAARLFNTAELKWTESTKRFCDQYLDGLPKHTLCLAMNKLSGSGGGGGGRMFGLILNVEGRVVFMFSHK